MVQVHVAPPPKDASPTAMAQAPPLKLIFHGKSGAYQEDVLISTRLLELARGVIPLAFCGTICLTCCRCLLCLLASQTALTPPAKPLGKPGLHHSHLPLLHGRAMASQAGRLCSACWSRARDARQRQRTGTVQTSSVRPPCPVPAMCPMGRSPGVLTDKATGPPTLCWCGALAGWCRLVEAEPVGSRVNELHLSAIPGAWADDVCVSQDCALGYSAVAPPEQPNWSRSRIACATL